MATGYWRFIPQNGNFTLYDHTPIETDRTSLVVQVTLPTTTVAITLNNNSLGYDLTNPASYPITIEPGDLTPPRSSFEDGIYRIQVSYNITTTPYTYDEYHMYIPTIDMCISDKLDTYLASLCTKCGNKELLHTLNELVVLRQGAHLDMANGRITKADQKITMMKNICTGTGCNCSCGC